MTAWTLRLWYCRAAAKLALKRGRLSWMQSGFLELWVSSSAMQHRTSPVLARNFQKYPRTPAEGATCNQQSMLARRMCLKTAQVQTSSSRSSMSDPIDATAFKTAY